MFNRKDQEKKQVCDLLTNVFLKLLINED